MIKLVWAISFLFVFAVIYSCKKDPIQYTFSGEVTESVSASALSGATVEITQKVYDGAVASTFYTAAGAFTTASDGTYEISFEREKVVEFKLDFSKSGYFDVAKVIQSADVTTEEANVVNQELEPKSWLTFHLVNIGGSTTDQFTMIHYNFREGCTGCTSNNYYYYDGIVDSTFTYVTTGGVYAKYAKNNPGSAVWTQDSAYMTPFDTVFVNINY